MENFSRLKYLRDRKENRSARANKKQKERERKYGERAAPRQNVALMGVKASKLLLDGLIAKEDFSIDRPTIKHFRYCLT